MLEGLSYDDVLLIPQKGILGKRKDADISSYVAGQIKVDIPIISAPMPSVTEHAMASAMLALGAQAVIHRFQPIDDRIEDWTVAWSAMGGGDPGDGSWSMAENPFVAIGLKETLTDIDTFREVGINRLCLDVAHGHHEQIGKLVSDLKHRWPSVILMVGNVATPQGALFLAEAGADAIKVGIGPGAACRTREVTGFGVPQLTALFMVKAQLDAYKFNIPIIADGGIKNSGDAVKALAAGASAVMLGSLLAGSEEAPKPGEYYGNASSRVNGHRAPEGVEGSVPLTGPVENIIKELAWGIRSGISYAGATDILGLQKNAEWIRIASGVERESSVRI